MSRRFAVLAGSIQRAKTLFLEMGMEQGWDQAWGVKSADDHCRGWQIDTLFIDESALPMPKSTWESVARTLKSRGGTAYVLSQLRPDQVKDVW